MNEIDRNGVRAEADGLAAEPAQTTATRNSGPESLTEAQRGIWFDYARAPEGAFTIGGYTVIEGRLDSALFHRAVIEEVAAHDALNLVFSVDENGVPQQTVRPSWTPEMAVLDLSDEADPLAALAERSSMLLEAAMDPTRDPLFLTTLCRLDDARYGWITVFHHLAADGWATALFIKGVAERYTALCAEGTGGATDAAPSFLEHARRLASDPGLAKSAEGWLDRFSRLPPPLFEARSVAGGPRARTVTSRIDAADWAMVGESAR
ncbi:MAG: condensation domain-containing protein, partial [Pseudomonadota bacterium]